MIKTYAKTCVFQEKQSKSSRISWCFFRRKILTSCASEDKSSLILSCYSKLWSDFLRGLYFTARGYIQLKFYHWEVLGLLIIVLFLAVAKSVSVFSVRSRVQEELAVLLSLPTLGAVQTTSWVIFQQRENAVASWVDAPPQVCSWKSRQKETIGRQQYSFSESEDRMKGQ